MWCWHLEYLEAFSAEFCILHLERSYSSNFQWFCFFAKCLQKYARVNTRTVFLCLLFNVVLVLLFIFLHWPQLDWSSAPFLLRLINQGQDTVFLILWRIEVLLFTEVCKAGHSFFFHLSFSFYLSLNQPFWTERTLSPICSKSKPMNVKMVPRK